MRPMLAGPADLSRLIYPVLVSPKLDGVRGLILDGRLVSRSLKGFPNRHVMSLFSHRELNGLDGELILGDPHAPDAYRRTNSAVSTQLWTPDVKFWVFDKLPFGRVEEYWQRLEAVRQIHFPNVLVVPTEQVDNEAALLKVEAKYLKEGYEGVMLRSLDGIYKMGRSSISEGYLLKLKRFVDSEAYILEVVEGLSNQNVARTNALGLTERSSHKANQKARGCMGSLRVRDVKTGVEFNIGTGFDAADCAWFWENRHLVVGQLVKYRFQPVGVKDKPRFPSYLGLRMEQDQ